MLIHSFSAAIYPVPRHGQLKNYITILATDELWSILLFLIPRLCVCLGQNRVAAGRAGEWDPYSGRIAFTGGPGGVGMRMTAHKRGKRTPLSVGTEKQSKPAQWRQTKGGLVRPGGFLGLGVQLLPGYKGMENRTRQFIPITGHGEQEDLLSRRDSVTWLSVSGQSLHIHCYCFILSVHFIRNPYVVSVGSTLSTRVASVLNVLCIQRYLSVHCWL